MIKEIPSIGLGTYLMKDKDILKGSIEAALKAGYKQIDTAQCYDNEQFIGQALEELNADRESIFITTKLDPYNYKYHTRESIEKSLERLKTDYLDLVLMHVAVEDKTNAIAYKELMKLREEGKIKHIGVSNFTIDSIKSLKDSTGEYPYVNQIRLSPLRRAQALEDFCVKNDIKLTGYSILVAFVDPMMDNPSEHFTDKQKEELEAMSKAHNKNIGQVLNRWALQIGYNVIPKSAKPERVRTNNQLLDFELTAKELETINSWNILKSEDYDKAQAKWIGAVKEEVYKEGYAL